MTGTNSWIIQWKGLECENKPELKFRKIEMAVDGDQISSTIPRKLSRGLMFEYIIKKVDDISMTHYPMMC